MWEPVTSIKNIHFIEYMLKCFDCMFKLIGYRFKLNVKCLYRYIVEEV